MGGGFGGVSLSTISGKCWDWHPTGEKVDRGYAHALHHGIQGINGGDREQTQG